MYLILAEGWRLYYIFGRLVVYLVLVVRWRYCTLFWVGSLSLTEAWEIPYVGHTLDGVPYFGLRLGYAIYW